MIEKNRKICQKFKIIIMNYLLQAGKPAGFI